ncbi:hypothetical protein ILYODFUR_002160 [Ilyodon furcidens]|uniref:Uncharacterized protein n=1 Tax=Ilyodon furcidens TaxID=33524 RepID=A0ABV0UPG0_9TELE
MIKKKKRKFIFTHKSDQKIDSASSIKLEQNIRQICMLLLAQVCNMIWEEIHTKPASQRKCAEDIKCIHDKGFQAKKDMLKKTACCISCVSCKILKSDRCIEVQQKRWLLAFEEVLYYK